MFSFNKGQRPVIQQVKASAADYTAAEGIDGTRRL